MTNTELEEAVVDERIAALKAELLRLKAGKWVARMNDPARKEEVGAAVRKLRDRFGIHVNPEWMTLDTQQRAELLVFYETLLEAK